MKRYIRAKIDFDRLNRSAKDATYSHLNSLFDNEESQSDAVDSLIGYLKSLISEKCKSAIADVKSVTDELAKDISDAIIRFNLPEDELVNLLIENFSGIEEALDGYVDFCWEHADEWSAVMDFINTYDDDVYFVVNFNGSPNKDISFDVKPFGSGISLWSDFLVDLVLDEIDNPHSVDDVDVAVEHAEFYINTYIESVTSLLSKTVEDTISACISQNPPSLQS